MVLVKELFRYDKKRRASRVGQILLLFYNGLDLNRPFQDFADGAGPGYLSQPIQLRIGNSSFYLNLPDKDSCSALPLDFMKNIQANVDGLQFPILSFCIHFYRYGGTGAETGQQIRIGIGTFVGTSVREGFVRYILMRTIRYSTGVIGFAQPNYHIVLHHTIKWVIPAFLELKKNSFSTKAPACTWRVTQHPEINWTSVK
jgi:hypothetical protein